MLDAPTRAANMRGPGCSRGTQEAGRGASADFRGDVAQLGEHLVRNEGVGGSNPLISTILEGAPATSQRKRRNRRQKWARASATRTCEPRQDRKVAAVSKASGVPLIPLALSVLRRLGPTTWRIVH